MLSTHPCTPLHPAGLLVVALLALPAGATAQTPPRLAATVELDVGGPDANPAHELLRVVDALRLADGRLVVASSRPLTVQLYDRNGARQRALGRSGGGPGEYEYGARLGRWGGDSVLIFSQGTRRWLLYRLDGTLVREWPASESHPPPAIGPVFRGNAILWLERFGAGGCPELALARHAPRSATTPLHEALVDPAGRLWIRSVLEDDWRVIDRAGTPIAVLQLPGEVMVLGFDGDRVIGVREDGDGFPHVLVLWTGLPRAPAVAAVPCNAPEMPVSRPRSAELKTAMRNAMMVAEAYYADRGTYPGRPADFPRSMLPDRSDFEVLGSGDRGYVFRIRDRSTGYSCLVSVGAGGFGRLPEGVLLCGG